MEIVYLPDVPASNGPIFGPRMQAMIGWMKSVGHCSYSTIETWIQDVLQVPDSRGYLAKLCTGPSPTRLTLHQPLRFLGHDPLQTFRNTLVHGDFCSVQDRRPQI
jgi:hypothetical protein